MNPIGMNKFVIIAMVLFAFQISASAADRVKAENEWTERFESEGREAQL